MDKSSTSQNSLPIKQCPASGQGCHAWLYHAACAAAEAEWPDEQAIPYIRERMTRDPSPSDEIESALAAARREDRPESRKWSGRNLDLIQEIKNGPEWSPKRPDAQTLPTLRLLFPNDPLLCIGRTSFNFTTAKLSSFKFLDRNQFIVPSAMSAVTGKTKKGTISEHCLENTGPRQYLVIEFDWGEQATQMKILRHLAAKKGPKLVMVVHSGSKSCHGWFDVRDLEEEGIIKSFFDYAVRCGADNRLWLRSQFCRLPAGTRDDGRPQSVLYLNGPYLRDRADSFLSISP